MGTLFAQESKPDSVFVKTILNKKYNFEIREEEENIISLRIKSVADSTELFDDFLRLKGGDCNGQIDMVAGFELHRDSLIFYSYRINTETWDVSKPHSSVIVLKEIYVFRSNGTLVKVGLAQAKQDDALWKEITGKLEKEIAGMN